MIKKEDVLEWKQHRVTQAYFEGIRELQKLLQENIGRGVTLTNHAERDTARAIGRIEGLEDALDVDLDTIIEGE